VENQTQEAVSSI